MPRILLGCAGWTVCLYAAAALLGFGAWPAAGPAAHRLVGLVAAFFTVAAHGLAFTLGIAWSRMLLEGVRAGALPAALAPDARRAMIRIDCWAMAAAGAVIAAAVLGAATDTGHLAAGWHGAAEAVALAVALAATRAEVGAFHALIATFAEATRALTAPSGRT